MPTQESANLKAVEREQAAFDARLDEMLREHPAEFVLFQGGKPVGFFPTYDEAYQAGLTAFGADSPFLVSEVKRRVPQTTSMAWEAGVMFGGY